VFAVGLSHKRILVYLEPRERVRWGSCKLSFFPVGGADSVPPNPLAGFEGLGLLRGGVKRGDRGRREGGKEGKVRKKHPSK